jgi:SAM-dependent methyltransferase
MLWDRHDLERYERWLASPRGAYALACECRLLESLMAGWPRRGRTLLEIGCGPGFFLEFFHRAGFDVTGLDKSPVMIEAARHRLGRNAECNLGDAHHLPYENDQFDYVALLTLLEFVEDPAGVLMEARRVARRAVIVGYVNRFSLYRLSAKRHKLLSQARWYTPWAMRHLARRVVGPAPIHEGSVLAGPQWSWREGFPFWGLGGAVLSVPVGAYCAFVADLTAEPPLTPIGAFAGAAPTKSF